MFACRELEEEESGKFALLTNDGHALFKILCNISSAGDGGGPLTVVRNGVPVLAGIASFVNIEGCERDYPQGFTRVGSYLDWIEANDSTRISTSYAVSALSIIVLVFLHFRF